MRLLPCFDLGGVLIRICRSWPEGAAQAGVPVRQRPARDMAQESALHRDYQSGRLAQQDYFRRLSAHWQGAYSPGEIEAIHRAWLYGPYPGVTALIEALAARGPVAALSNTSSQHWAMLRTLPVVQAIPVALASQEIGAMKPESAAYEAVERATGRRGEEILFFDDAPANLEAAAARGWQTVQVDPLVPCTAPALRQALTARGLL